jgi:hypothetical protein
MKILKAIYEVPLLVLALYLLLVPGLALAIYATVAGDDDFVDSWSHGIELTWHRLKTHGWGSWG